MRILKRGLDKWFTTRCGYCKTTFLFQWADVKLEKGCEVIRCPDCGQRYELDFYTESTDREIAKSEGDYGKV